MPVLNPDHLIDQANYLVDIPGRGAPRQVDLRRAISSVYYALFHAVLTAAADSIVGRTHRDTPRYQLVYRSINHTSISNICEQIEKTTLAQKFSKYQPRGGFHIDLKNVATTFLYLQERRHLADYDPLYRVTISEARLVILAGREALARFQSVNAEHRNAFSSLLLFAPR